MSMPLTAVCLYPGAILLSESKGIICFVFFCTISVSRWWTAKADRGEGEHGGPTPRHHGYSLRRCSIISKKAQATKQIMEQWGFTSRCNVKNRLPLSICCLQPHILDLLCVYRCMMRLLARCQVHFNNVGSPPKIYCLTIPEVDNRQAHSYKLWDTSDSSAKVKRLHTHLLPAKSKMLLKYIHILYKYHLIWYVRDRRGLFIIRCRTSRKNRLYSEVPLR